MRLSEAIPFQLSEAVRLQEADEMHYLTEGGEVDNPFEVYKRAGEPCSRCGTPIADAPQGGRRTYWCPGCQR